MTAHFATDTTWGWWRGALFWRFWVRFAILDILLRYRRTILGPFWLTLSFGLTAAGLSFVFTALFQVSAEAYVPYLVAGLSTWMYVSGSINEGCTTMVRHAGVMREYSMPPIVHSLRDCSANLIVFAHNLVVVLVLAVVFQVPLTLWTLFVFPAILLLFVNTLWLIHFFGLLCARYRDLPQIITTIVNLAFLVTPVFWFRDQLGTRVLIADFNPFFHLIEIVRAPMLGQAPPVLSVLVVCLIAIVGWFLTLVTAARMEKKLIYWV
ncbi:MAG: ABC transporter permease [Alphaproteobacteria bacterium]|nr:ABC transporter permease [Alphaproteobacteria bacterium]